MFKKLFKSYDVDETPPIVVNPNSTKAAKPKIELDSIEICGLDGSWLTQIIKNSFKIEGINYKIQSNTDPNGEWPRKLKYIVYIKLNNEIVYKKDGFEFDKAIVEYDDNTYFSQIYYFHSNNSYGNKSYNKNLILYKNKKLYDLTNRTVLKEELIYTKTESTILPILLESNEALKYIVNSLNYSIKEQYYNNYIERIIYEIELIAIR